MRIVRFYIKGTTHLNNDNKILMDHMCAKIKTINTAAEKALAL